MIDINKLVSKDYLKKFGDKCKKLFKLRPYHTITGSGRFIVIKTSLSYDGLEEGFDDLYLNIQGISRGERTGQNNDQIDSSDKVLNSSFYIKTSSLYSNIDFALGFNYGREVIQAAVFMKDASDEKSLNICLIIPENRVISDCIVDILACHEETLLYNVIKEVNIFYSVDEPASQNDYLLIVIDNSVIPYSKTETIGDIIIPAQEETAFTVAEDYDVIQGIPFLTESTDYSHGTIFNKIYEATLASKLNHNITFLYDWNNHLTSADDPVEITNPNLASGEVVKIPIPDLFSNGVTSNDWVTKVKILNGIVVEAGDYTLPKASTSVLGGMLLGESSPNVTSLKIWVLLDSEDRAFIDSYYLESDKHRDDLNKSIYTDNINNYEGLIWQHIGDTTSSFINGYFYKCIKTSYSVDIQSNLVYNIGGRIASKLEGYIYDNGLLLDLNKKFKLYVDPLDYVTRKEVSGVTHDVLISELDTFKLINVAYDDTFVGEPITLTKTQLLAALDVTMKTTDGWDTALVKDYLITVMDLYFSLNPATYAWKQWNVQPTGESASVVYITNPEIDYLFDTHVTGITLRHSTLGLFVGDSATLVATVLPDNADNKTIEWTTSDSSIATVTKISPTQATVVAAAEGECTITCTSLDNRNIKATCTLIITEFI